MPTIDTLLQQRFSAAVAAAFGADLAEIDPLIRPSSNPQFGDYQANLAMSLEKQLKAKPREVAQRIVEKLDLGEVCEKVEVAGPGFINLHLRPDFISAQAAAMAHDARLGVAAPAEPRTVVIDYSGPNLAKEMHVGHLRSSVIGDAVARTLAFLGHRVIRQNHLGDWGTQFGMLVQHLVETGWDRSGDHAIADLNTLYQEAKKRFDDDAAFADRARKRVVALQGGDPQTLEYWRLLIDESRRHMNAIYRRLGVLLEDADIRPESFYNPMLPEVAAELEAKGLARASEGALCVFPPGFLDRDNRPLPVIVRKSDGGYGYAATDLAALRYRARQLGARRIVYFTDARQKQHFAMVFAVARMAGWLESPAGPVAADHAPFGAILGQDGKPFKTRSGESVKLGDLLDEAEGRALAVIDEKNPDLAPDQRREVAKVVGIGAVKYVDLSTDRIKDYVFDWDRMLSFDGNTAPYLQNAYVRIRSIFRKAGLAAPPPATISVAQPAERALALKLLQFGGVVEGVGEALEPHRLCGYLYDLAAAYHQFYETCPVLQASDGATRDSRLALCDLAARTLRQGLDLLGIGVVEQM